MVDYSLWEVIENGNKLPVTTVVEGVETTIAPVTAEEKAQRRLELKAISTLLMGIPNEHQLKFNSIKDAKNKPEIDTLSLDDLYNNFKVYEPEVKGVSSSSTNTQNMAFVSSSSNNNTNSSNEAVNTAFEVTTIGTRVNAPNSTNIDNLSDAIICAFLASLEYVEARLLVYKKNKYVYEEDIKLLKCEIYLKDITIIELRRKLELAQKQKDNIQLTVEKFKNLSKSLSKLLDSQIADKYKAGLRYNVVPRPYTGNFLPPKPDLSGLEEFLNEPIVNEPTVKKPVVETSEAKASEDKPKVVRKNYSPPLIEEWISNSEDKAESMPKIEKKTVKPTATVNTATPVSTAHPKTIMNAAKPRPKEVVNTARPKAVLNVVKGNEGNPQQGLQKKGVIDSECSRHMTGNMSYLTYYEEIDEGYVAFGGNLKGRKITGKGTIRTGK
uniref:Retrovirus-related Pol polyprotein from transposon TNT 1-94-like beta-barrel domain-containing protein n=1 Tax=Tanacetum cinerariifolium TaxID=118510 RepID=A0A6L2JN61_TANCI|nr:hypothetical protein [Tanacetum cinerariifolium]